MVPNLALLVVVAAALVRGPEFAAVLGFAAGLAVDLAPPADRVAGRWALALVVVGYLAGRVRREAGASACRPWSPWPLLVRRHVALRPDRPAAAGPGRAVGRLLEVIAVACCTTC